MTTKPLRVLVIDDSPPFRRQVAAALEASGLSVAEASEGYEALWRVRAEGVFDLILADIHMPNLDGLVFIREVRKLPEYAQVPIFVLTSDGSRERREEGRSAGASAWLLKPPDLPALVNTVHAALLQLIKAKDPDVAARPSLTPIAGPSSTRNTPLSSRAPSLHGVRPSSLAPARRPSVSDLFTDSPPPPSRRPKG
jgi:two-component system, chemotaxis family, chemotaxis protein CheY